MATHDDFHKSAKRLIGSKLHSNLVAAGYNINEFCREIAQHYLIGTLEGSATKDEDLQLIKAVAKVLM